MPRKAIQLLVLPFLFALLAAGGNATLCDAVSLLGFESHHHASTCGGDEQHSNPLCLQGAEGCDSDSEKIPCSESCEIKLSEAPAPTLHKVPQLPEVLLSSLFVECYGVSLVAVFSAEIPAVQRLALPGERPSLFTPCFTGCYLI